MNVNALRVLVLSMCLAITGRPTRATVASPEELSTAREWIATHTAGGRARDVPFSFVYAGKPSREILGTWKVSREARALDDERTQSTVTYCDPQSGLVVRCVSTAYTRFPAVEWVVYVKNGGSADTPILEKVQAIDLSVARSAAGDFVVHHAKGSDAAFSDFAPSSDAVPPGRKFTLHSHGWPTSMGSPSGSPSVEALPFFNVQWGDEGLIGGLGWTGPWIAEFGHDKARTLTIRAGMDGTHLKLHPGEQIRSPRALVLFWKGDRWHGQNLWRRLILAHYSPRPGGKPFTGLLCDANWGSWMTADKHIEEIDWWSDHQLPMECYWMDAGWTDMSKGWVAHQSQQVPNKALFPKGLRPVSDAARRRGMKFLLWFVPESVFPGVGIAAQHPEWLGKPFSHKPAFGDMVFYGLDHGDPRINMFMIDHFSKTIADHGVDIFRQDGLSLWPEDTAPDRNGISQIRYTEGFYAFWDGLLKKNPDLLIDNCGCGARKVDLETIRRSIVFWRSDSQASGDFDPVSTQGFNYGLFPWLPLSGAPVPMPRLSPYAFRSAYCPALLVGWPMVNITDLPGQRWSGVDLTLLRRLLNEYLAIRPYLFGDYYPLTSYSIEKTTWIAWQFDRPELGQGMVQAFRREKSIYESARCRLRGLDAEATYEVTDLDTNAPQRIRGRELMDKGLLVRLTTSPAAAVVVYKKTPN